MFYSGAGFKSRPSIPHTWEKQVLCFKPSIDINETEIRHLVERACQNFHDKKEELQAWDDFKSLNSTFLSAHNLSDQQSHEISPKEQLISLHHNMKSLLFSIQQHDPIHSIVQLWETDFKAELLSISPMFHINNMNSVDSAKNLITGS